MNVPIAAAELRAKLAASLPAADWGRLEQVRRLAGEAGTPTYLAGGLVRDLLLRRPTTDMDFVVVGRGPAEPARAFKLAGSLARSLARAHGGAVTVHPAFGTATWHDPQGAALDFATARTETYAHPGALPTVAPAPDMATDLRRRDFTINAMALRIDGDHLGELVDPHGGQADLAAGLIRVLHADSFRDDPTRLFRAARYAERLKFRIAEATEALWAGALPVVAVLSGERVRHELEMAFREAHPAGVLAAMERRGLLAAAHPVLRWGAAETADASDLATLPRPSWQWSAPWPVDSIYLALLLRGAAPAEAVAALDRLSAPRAVVEAVTGGLSLRLEGTRPSEVVAQVDALSLEGVVAAYAAQPALRERLAAYLARWRHVRAALTGDDLVRLGLAPGPRFKPILWRLRAARLDGEVNDEAGELALVRALANWE
jgi:tRNA nucleotidyltransferase (CCA-adding enzyme)